LYSELIRNTPPGSRIPAGGCPYLLTIPHRVPTMSRIAYVNGRYQPWRDATVHIEDRGYQFSDGVYEVCEVRSGRIVDERRHMARLSRSLKELRIDIPMSLQALAVVMREVIARNRVSDGIVYL
jgi:D-alanine transaminase